MDELDGGGSCTGGSMRIGPSVPIGSGQGASVVTSYTPPRPPQLHSCCAHPWGLHHLYRGPNFERLRPQPIAPALRSAPQNGGPNTRKWTSWTAGVPAGVARRELGPSVPIGSGQGAAVVTSYTPPRPPQLHACSAHPWGLLIFI